MIISFVLSMTIFFSLIASIYFSTTARSKKTYKEQGMTVARMNISMGIMLVAISILQIAFFESSTIRYIVGAVFLLLGAFNLYGGIRNYRIYKHLPAETTK
ncbi:YtpI family protein [Marinicrinis sediminis]|uniref:YtpI family protein n=1 Tax=Marinicrinis sediminis TaxID=1652465 RepID=A0ABW5R8R3_9BACL